MYEMLFLVGVDERESRGASVIQSGRELLVCRALLLSRSEWAADFDDYIIFSRGIFSLLQAMKSVRIFAS
jgi:hypothetical protein